MNQDPPRLLDGGGWSSHEFLGQELALADDLRVAVQAEVVGFDHAAGLQALRLGGQARQIGLVGKIGGAAFVLALALFGFARWLQTEFAPPGSVQPITDFDELQDQPRRQDEAPVVTPLAVPPPPPPAIVRPDPVPKSSRHRERVDRPSEYELVMQARQGMPDEPTQTLARLMQAERLYPQGQLLPERRALRVRALVAAGDLEKARAVAERFLEQYAEHPLADTVRRAVP